MTVTQPLRDEHADLLPHLAELDTVAADLADWNPDTPARLDAIVEFLRGLSSPTPGPKRPPSTPASNRP